MFGLLKDPWSRTGSRFSADIPQVCENLYLCVRIIRSTDHGLQIWELQSISLSGELCHLTRGIRNEDIKRSGLWETWKWLSMLASDFISCWYILWSLLRTLCPSRSTCLTPSPPFLKIFNNWLASSQASERDPLGEAEHAEYNWATDGAGGLCPRAQPCHRVLGTRETIIYWNLSVWAASTWYFDVYEITSQGEGKQLAIRVISNNSILKFTVTKTGQSGCH